MANEGAVTVIGTKKSVQWYAAARLEPRARARKSIIESMMFVWINIGALDIGKTRRLRGLISTSEIHFAVKPPSVLPNASGACPLALT